MRCAVVIPFIMGDRVYGSVMDLIDETFPVPDYEAMFLDLELMLPFLMSYLTTVFKLLQISEMS